MNHTTPRTAKPNASGVSWLDFVDGMWMVNEDKADTVRFIYQLAYAGRSAPEIVQALHEEKVPPIGKRLIGGKPKTLWQDGDINALLVNPAVHGAGKYPSIIDKGWWDDIQWVRAHSPGGKQNSGNLFAALLKCGKCKTGVRFRKFKDRSYVECYNPHFEKRSYDVLEPLLIEHIFGNALFIQVPESRANFRSDLQKRQSTQSCQRWIAYLRSHIARIEITDEAVKVIRRNKRVTKL